MKKFSKLVALSLAAALTFGMTVSAAGSSTTTNNGEVITSEALAADAAAVNAEAEEVKAEDGKMLKALPLTVDVAGNAVDQALANVENQVENLGEVEATVLNLKVVDDNDNVVDPAGVERQIPGYTVPAGKNTVDVYHCDDNGNITNKVPSRVEGDKVFAKFSNLSPIVIIAYDVKDDGDDDDDDDDTAAATTTTSVAASTGAVASPKTGETLPVAVLFAVASLGAAVVCSRKARYNK